MSSKNKSCLLLDQARLAIKSLAIYKNVFQKPPLSILSELLDHIHARDLDFAELTELYCRLFYSLAGAGCGISLKNHIIRSILLDENPFSIAASRRQDNIADCILDAVRKDLDKLELIAGISSEDIFRWFLEGSGKLHPDEKDIAGLPRWSASQWYDQDGISSSEPAKNLSGCTLWKDMLPVISDYHMKWGCGIFARFKALHWKGLPDGLSGIENPDDVSLADLIGYESSREMVIENTLAFIKGFPANNVLLYGDRGTGKSSTVKAILNEYFHMGLRIVELPKSKLQELNELLDALNGHGLKFIIFIDDLTFEDKEENYTSMKALLEGSMKKLPENVLIYATSNRRHLIKEYFSDRHGPQTDGNDEEVRSADTYQEKLSLSDRFGITALFPSPDKGQFLNIVKELALRRGIRMDDQELYSQALIWEMRFNGRSPRTAVQFVDWLSSRVDQRLSFDEGS